MRTQNSSTDPQNKKFVIHMHNLISGIKTHIGKLTSNRRKLQFGFYLNEFGLRAQYMARNHIKSIYPELSGDFYYQNLLDLHKKISHELQKQMKEYPHFIYEQGFPYQALNILGIYGIRPTETRFSEYGLSELIGKGDRILDIGCNCGFMLVYTSYRTGCSGDGIDINPYMINIGNHVAEFLGVSKKINLSAQRFQDFQPSGKYTVIFSFATHWTDDEQLRPDFYEYMHQLYTILSDNGLLIFESHTADIGNKTFYDQLELQKKYFSWSGSKMLNNNRRELFIMRKKSG